MGIIKREAFWARYHSHRPCHEATRVSERATLAQTMPLTWCGAIGTTLGCSPNEREQLRAKSRNWYYGEQQQINKAELFDSYYEYIVL